MFSLHASEDISFDAPWEDIGLDRAKPNFDDVYTLPRNGANSLKQPNESQCTPKARRRVAGNKRVAQYRTNQGFKSGAGQVLQSITAAPALKHSSFEELRVECYAQSHIAKGGPPTPVDLIKAPWAAIPPTYNAFVDTSEDQNDDKSFSIDVTMKD